MTENIYNWEQLTKQGMQYFEKGEFEKAIEVLEKAKIQVEKEYNKYDSNYETVLNNLALLYERVNEYVKAEPLYLEARQDMIAQIDKLFPSLSEKEKALFYTTHSSNFERFFSFALLRKEQNPSITSSLFNYQLVTKALLFQDTSKVRAHILESKDTSLISLHQNWLIKRNTIAKLYQMSVAEKQKRRLDKAKLEEEANELEKSLSKQSELFA